MQCYKKKNFICVYLLRNLFYYLKIPTTTVNKKKTKTTATTTIITTRKLYYSRKAFNMIKNKIHSIPLNTQHNALHRNETPCDLTLFTLY